MVKQATNIRLFSLEQIPYPGANLQKANARPWEQVQLKMPDKRPGGSWAPMELIETLVYRCCLNMRRPLRIASMHYKCRKCFVHHKRYFVQTVYDCPKWFI